MLGLICVGLTILLALLPWILDCRTDAKIRTAMAFQDDTVGDRVTGSLEVENHHEQLRFRLNNA
jgi:hypothetical protein